MDLQKVEKELSNTEYGFSIVPDSVKNLPRDEEGWPLPLSEKDQEKANKYFFHSSVVRGVISNGKDYTSFEHPDGTIEEIEYDYYKLQDDTDELRDLQRYQMSISGYARTRKPYRGKVEETLGHVFDKYTLDKTNLKSAADDLEIMIEEKTRIFQEKLYPLALDNFVYFSALIDPQYPPTDSGHLIYLMEEVSRNLEDEDSFGLGCSIAAGQAKSQTLTIKLSVFLYQKYVDSNVLIVTGGGSLLKQSYTAIKSLFEGETYMRFFFGHAPYANMAAQGIYRPSGKRYIAFRTVEGNASGVRATFTILDDLVPSSGSAQSAVFMSSLHRFLGVDLLPRMDEKGSKIFFANTRFAENDHVDRFLGMINPDSPKYIPQINYSIITIPIICNSKNDPLGRVENEVLWPKKMDYDQLMIKKAMMASDEGAEMALEDGGWEVIYMCQFLSSQNILIEENMLSLYQAYPSHKGVDYYKTYLSIDTNSKMKESSDDTAIGVFREDMKGNLFLIYMEYKPMHFDLILERIKSLTAQFDVDITLMEDAAAGMHLGESLKYKPSTEVKGLKMINVSTVSKQFRLDACLPFFRDGRFLMPAYDTDWKKETLTQLLKFPYYRKDDIVDSISLIINEVAAKNRRGTLIKVPMSFGEL